MIYSNKLPFQSGPGVVGRTENGHGKASILTPDEINNFLQDYIIISSNYTLLDSDPNIIYCDTTTSEFALKLPVNPVDKDKFFIKNIGTNNFDLILNGNSYNIERSSDNLTLAQDEAIIIQYTSSLDYLIKIEDRPISSGLRTPRWWLKENYTQIAADYEVHNLAGGSSEIKMDAGSTYLIEKGAIVII